MPDQPPLSFPDRPRSELEHALHELMERADEVMRTQGRLRALLRATQAVVEPIELPVVLERIVRAAAELVDAEYGALGVVAPDGGLEEFIHVGMPAATVAAIGHLPEGHGLLGALIDDPRPIRLRQLGDDPRSAGFPPGHPRMDGFLGVPIRVREEVYGNLYLTNPRRAPFSAEDEELVTALAATAGFAIANARRFDETRTRQRWAASSAQVTATLLEASGAPALPMLADELMARGIADRICIVLPGAEPLTVRVAEARGAGAEELDGAVIPAMRTEAAIVLESGESRARRGGRLGADAADALAIVTDGSAGPLLCVALQSSSDVWGVLAVARRPGETGFTTAEILAADDLAGRTGIAIELAAAREERQRALLVDDRTRIARDLHDHVIQQLFGTGLELQALAAAAPGTVVASRLEESVVRLDDAIAQIRTAIFAMTPRTASDTSLRNRILDLAGEYTRLLPQPVAVTFSGPVDLVVAGPLAEDVAAVARELLANVVKHAEADRVRLVVAVDDEVGVVVEDDGAGMPQAARRSGLANLAARAERRGGHLAVDSVPGRTVVTWRVPSVPMPEGAA